MGWNCFNQRHEAWKEFPQRAPRWADGSPAISLPFTDFHLFLAGGHEDFSKMIDEAEPLGYPVVVKSTRGHQGQCCASRASLRAAALPWQDPYQARQTRSSPSRSLLWSPHLCPLLSVPTVLAFIRPFSSLPWSDWTLTGFSHSTARTSSTLFVCLFLGVISLKQIYSCHPLVKERSQQPLLPIRQKSRFPLRAPSTLDNSLHLPLRLLWPRDPP